MLRTLLLLLLQTAVIGSPAPQCTASTSAHLAQLFQTEWAAHTPTAPLLEEGPEHGDPLCVSPTPTLPLPVCLSVMLPYRLSNTHISRLLRLSSSHRCFRLGSGAWSRFSTPLARHTAPIREAAAVSRPHHWSRPGPPPDLSLTLFEGDSSIIAHGLLTDCTADCIWTVNGESG